MAGPDDRRLAIDRLRSNRRRAAHEQAVEAPPDPRIDPDLDARSACTSLGRDRRFARALRIATVLAAIEGHDLKEVSRLLDVPEGTIKGGCSRLETLQEKLRWMTTGKA